MQHLALNWRKVLNARLSALKATSRYWADARVEQLDRAFEQLEGHFLLLAAGLEDSPDHESLLISLGNLGRGLNVALLTNNQHVLFQQAYHEFCLELDSVRCMECIGTQFCGSDPQIIDQHGACLAFFRHCRQLAHAESIAWYERFLPGALSRFPSVELSTTLCCKPPATIAVGQQLSGRTNFPAEAAFHSEIELLINVAEVDLESYYAAAYVLFHEFVCHAFQGVRHAQLNAQRRTKETDSFAEGWMDRVTFHVFRAVVEGNGFSHMKGEVDSEAVRLVNRYRDARLGLPRGPQTNRTQAHFQIGDEAAEAFHAFLMGADTRISSRANELFYRISFDWNLEGDCLERRLFVENVRKGLSRKGLQAYKTAFEKGLGDYDNSLLIKDLVKHIPRDNRFI